jgi:C4-dicarboxylate-specific signal transduction histidine kinase
LIFNGRRVQISQVLLNLISNSFDAVVEQSDRWIELKVVAGPQQIELSVADSGPTIPADVRARLFEPFFTTKFGNKGTGLGLSISRGIAEDHGGSLRLDEGPTTRFLLNLPLN